MEKRSHRRIRDLDVLTAFQGLVANEIGCARISMMASEQETLPQWAEYRCARPIISRSSHPACTARPVHTEVHGQAMWTAVGTKLFQSYFMNCFNCISPVDASEPLCLGVEPEFLEASGTTDLPLSFHPAARCCCRRPGFPAGIILTPPRI